MIMVLLLVDDDAHVGQMKDVTRDTGAHDPQVLNVISIVVAHTPTIAYR